MDTIDLFPDDTPAAHDEPSGRTPARRVAVLAAAAVLAVAVVGAASALGNAAPARPGGAAGPTTYSSASPFDRVRATQASVDRHTPGDASRAAVVDVRYAAQTALASSAVLACVHAAHAHNY